MTAARAAAEIMIFVTAAAPATDPLFWDLQIDPPVNANAVDLM